MIFDLDTIDLNIFLLQHKAIGVGNNFKNLDRPLPVTTFKSFSPQGNVCVCILQNNFLYYKTPITFTNGICFSTVAISLNWPDPYQEPCNMVWSRLTCVPANWIWSLYIWLIINDAACGFVFYENYGICHYNLQKFNQFCTCLYAIINGFKYLTFIQLLNFFFYTYMPLMFLMFLKHYTIDA